MISSHLVGVEVWHDGEDFSFPEHTLPPGGICALVPHLGVVVSVRIQHLAEGRKEGGGVRHGSYAYRYWLGPPSTQVKK